MFFLEIFCIQNDCVKIHKLNQWTSIQPGNFTKYCKSYYTKLFPNVNVKQTKSLQQERGAHSGYYAPDWTVYPKTTDSFRAKPQPFKKKTIRVLEMGSLGLFKTFLPWKNISTYFTTLELGEVQD